MRVRSIIILTVMMLSMGFPLAAQSHSDTPSKQREKEGVQPSPQSIALQFLDKVEKQLLTADYTIELLAGTQRQPVGSGKLQMLGRCFKLNILSTEAAFDGETLYMYQEETNELTLSNPTEEELLDVNPMLFARALLRNSTVRFAANAKNNTPNGELSLDFLPTNKDAGIQRFVLKLRKADLAPLEIQIREQQQQTIIRFSHASFSPKVSSSALFQLVYPSAWLNDLR